MTFKQNLSLSAQVGTLLRCDLVYQQVGLVAVFLFGSMRSKQRLFAQTLLSSVYRRSSYLTLVCGCGRGDLWV